MKKIAMMVAMAMLPLQWCMAYDVVGNPDRKVSFGFNYDHVGTSSEYSFLGSRISDFTKIASNSFMGDVKIPMSPMVTFQLRGSYLNSENSIFTGERIETTGYDIGIGIRFYLQ